MENREPITGPWRATRLWNDIIRNLRNDMPTRKHMKNLKTYDNCFSSSEVIDWLHKNLQKNSNFGSDVTKEQTIQLLNKLARARIIINVRDEESQEFREGELFKLTQKSPVRNLRTPGKSDKKEEKRAALADVGNGNTPRRNLELENYREDEKSDISSLDDREKAVRKPSLLSRRKRDTSARRAKEEAIKRDLNLSYFQSLPANSLIILDNDSTWRKVFSAQLALSLSPHHVKLLEQAELLNIDRVMHNMTRVSSKGIVQLDDKREDLPHWVLSAMKCLANWPRQLRTVNGRESCLPSYPGFEQDVFNVVKDYFLDLKEPLTTFGLYDHFLDAYIKAEAVAAIPRPVHTPAHVSPPSTSGCHVHPGSASRVCSRPYTQTDLDQKPLAAGQFYTMSEADSEDFLLLTNQERTAKIKATFSCLPPLATSSVKTQDSSLTSGSTPNTSSLSPDMSTTAIMKTFLPPNSCFETVFLGNSPVTRIVPQAESETLHISRSGSCRSLTHIPTYGHVTKTAGTQTDKDNDKESVKRMPRWRRYNRPGHKRSASIGHSDESRSSTESGAGLDNYGYTTSPPLSTSLDNILAGDSNKEKNNFLLKYRQVSGDLRGSQELVDTGPDPEADPDRDRRSQSLVYPRSSRDRSIIESKTVRKEKRKNRYRDTSGDRLQTGLTPALRKVKMERGEEKCYSNSAMDTSSDHDDNVFVANQRPRDYVPTNHRAPLATQECDLSPVPNLSRSSYNASYRLATNHNLPRTSTKVRLDNVRSVEPVYATQEPVYTVPGAGPIKRFTVPSVDGRHSSQTLPHRGHKVVPPPRASLDTYTRVAPLTRGNVARASLYSVATQDSGHYSQVSSLHRSPSPTAMFKLLTLLLPPSYRRRLQLLLKFILKISVNQNLRLDPNMTNGALALDTFLEVILRPSNLSRHNRELAGHIVQYFLDHYEQVLTPPQDLRREVEEQVYRSLVSRRLEAGEDPYPVTYCEQVTRNQYEQNRLTGSQAALKDLLEALLRDEKMERKAKKRKLRKFKEAYPDMWRAKFPHPDLEPEYVQPSKEKSRLGSLSKLKSAIRM